MIVVQVQQQSLPSVSSFTMSSQNAIVEYLRSMSTIRYEQGDFTRHHIRWRRRRFILDDWRLMPG